jgi:cytoskeleton protein RodZ
VTVRRNIIGPKTAAAVVVPTPRAVPTVLAATASATTATSSAAQPLSVMPTQQVVAVIGPTSAWLEVVVDGQPAFSGILLPGTSRAYEGRRVEITTGNAGSTQVTVNGVVQGAMGKDQEVAKRTY